MERDCGCLTADSVSSSCRDALRKDHLLPVGANGPVIETGRGVDGPDCGRLRPPPAWHRGGSRGVHGSPERRPAGLGRGMIARRRRVRVRDPDVPEYPVYNHLIRDERDDPHGRAAPGAEQRILLPDHPHESRPSYTPAFEQFAIVTVGVINPTCRRFVAAARYPALRRGVGVTP
jgi:hypothetical protein